MDKQCKRCGSTSSSFDSAHFGLLCTDCYQEALERRIMSINQLEKFLNNNLLNSVDTELSKQFMEAVYAAFCTRKHVEETYV